MLFGQPGFRRRSHMTSAFAIYFPIEQPPRTALELTSFPLAKTVTSSVPPLQLRSSNDPSGRYEYVVSDRAGPPRTRRNGRCVRCRRRTPRRRSGGTWLRHATGAPRAGRVSHERSTSRSSRDRRRDGANSSPGPPAAPVAQSTRGDRAHRGPRLSTACNEDQRYCSPSGQRNAAAVLAGAAVGGGARGRADGIRAAFVEPPLRDVHQRLQLQGRGFLNVDLADTTWRCGGAVAARLLSRADQESRQLARVFGFDVQAGLALAARAAGSTSATCSSASRAPGRSAAAARRGAGASAATTRPGSATLAGRSAAACSARAAAPARTRRAAGTAARRAGDTAGAGRARDARRARRPSARPAPPGRPRDAAATRSAATTRRAAPRTTATRRACAT